MKKPIQIEIGNLFSGHTTAGFSFPEFEALPPNKKLIKRMGFIRDEAARLGNATYHIDCGIPGNLIGEAQRLHRAAALAVEAAERDDLADAALRALDVGALMEGLNKSLAVWRALSLKRDVQRPRSSGGETTAEKRRNEQDHRAQEVARIWQKLDSAGRPKHERCSLISDRLGIKPDTVRRLIRKTGLR